MIINELENVKQGGNINYDFIDNLDYSYILLGISILRESNIKEQKCIEYLLKYSTEKDIVISSSATNALIQKAENDLIDLEMILSCSIFSKAYFKVLDIVLNKTDKKIIKDKLELINQKIQEGLREVITKYSTLSVIATLKLILGESQNIFERNLSPINISIIKSMLDSKTKL